MLISPHYNEHASSPFQSGLKSRSIKIITGFCSTVHNWLKENKILHVKFSSSDKPEKREPTRRHLWYHTASTPSPSPLSDQSLFDVVLCHCSAGSGRSSGGVLCFAQWGVRYRSRIKRNSAVACNNLSISNIMKVAWYAAIILVGNDRHHT